MLGRLPWEAERETCLGATELPLLPPTDATQPLLIRYLSATPASPSCRLGAERPTDRRTLVIARKLPEEPKTEVESLRVVNRNEAQEDGGSRAVFSRLVLLLTVRPVDARIGRFRAEKADPLRFAQQINRRNGGGWDGFGRTCRRSDSSRPATCGCCVGRFLWKTDIVGHWAGVAQLEERLICNQ